MIVYTYNTSIFVESLKAKSGIDVRLLLNRNLMGEKKRDYPFVKDVLNTLKSEYRMSVVTTSGETEYMECNMYSNDPEKCRKKL